MTKNTNFILLAANLFFNLIISKLIQLPTVEIDVQRTININQKANLSSVLDGLGDFKIIYKSEVKKIQNGERQDFNLCYFSNPTIKYQGQSYLSFSSILPNYKLIYDYEQKKSFEKVVIDAAYSDRSITFALRNGLLKFALISETFDQIKEIKSFRLEEEIIHKGNVLFFKAPRISVFINNNQLSYFTHEDMILSKVEGYKSYKNYQTAMILDQMIFAVAYGSDGVKIFSFDYHNNRIILQAQVKQMEGIKQINFIDLEYDKKRRILYILDKNEGVLAVQIKFEQSLTLKTLSLFIKQKQCNLVYYDSFNDELYLGCRQLRKFRINNWPIFDEKVLPRQDIAVRQITSSGPVVALVGRDVFQILVADRKAAIYEDKLMDKLILGDHNLILIGQKGILLLYYKLMPLELYCSSEQKQSVGSYLVQLQIQTACNLEYLKQKGFDTSKIGMRDQCLYKIIQKIKIEVKSNFSLLTIAVLVVFLIGYYIKSRFFTANDRFKAISMQVNEEGDHILQKN